MRRRGETISGERPWGGGRRPWRYQRRPLDGDKRMLATWCSDGVFDYSAHHHYIEARSNSYDSNTGLTRVPGKRKAAQRR